MRVETRWGDREFQLVRGDITKLDFPVDLMVLSSIGHDFTPTRTSVIGALDLNFQISVKQLSENPEINLTRPMTLWVSRDTGHTQMRRIMCVEIAPRDKDADRMVEGAFYILPLLEARQLPLSTICMPILAIGDHGLSPQQMVRPILKGAAWTLKNVASVDRVCLVDRAEERAKMLSEAMNAELGRSSVTLPKSELVDGIRKHIIDRLDMICKLDPYMNDSVLGAKLIQNSTSEQIGMAARQLRDYVIVQLLGKGRRDRNAEYDALKDKGIAEWVISYLNLLRTIGNETAHEPMDRRESEKRRPARLESGDLALCLFAIQTVLDFWAEWLSGAKASRQVGATDQRDPSRGSFVT